jgi:hypothetical protein
MRADPPSIDPTALAAVHYTFNQSFGPGTTCQFPATNPPGLCLATVPFSVPAGQRFVIQDLSANVAFNANGGGDVLAGAIGILLNVGGTIANYTFPFDSSKQVGNTTYYYINKNVKIYADPAIGFGWEIANLTGVGPVFTTGTGSMSITVSGYLVPLSGH